MTLSFRPLITSRTTNPIVRFHPAGWSMEVAAACGTIAMWPVIGGR